MRYRAMWCSAAPHAAGGVCGARMLPHLFRSWRPEIVTRIPPIAQGMGNSAHVTSHLDSHQ